MNLLTQERYFPAIVQVFPAGILEIPWEILNTKNKLPFLNLSPLSFISLSCPTSQIGFNQIYSCPDPLNDGHSRIS